MSFCLCVHPLLSYDGSLASGFSVREVVFITVINSLHKYVLKNDPDKLDSDSL